MSVLFATLLAASTINVDDDRLVFEVALIKEFEWQEIATSPSGQRYLIAPDEIANVNYLGVPMKKTLVLIENFQGASDANRRWSVMYVRCDKGDYNEEWSMVYKANDVEAFAKPNNDQVSFTNANAGTPMDAIVQAVCAAQ